MQFVTLNTITTDLLSIIRASKISQSETISKRQLEEWVHEYRGVLLKQDLDKGKNPNPDYIQEIDFLKLEPIDIIGSNVLSINNVSMTGCYLLRTALEIPKTIDLNFKSGFTYIGTVDGHEIQFIPQSRSKWQQYKKYTKDDNMCFLSGGYLYITSDNEMEYITVKGIFEVPPEVSRFVNPITSQPYFNMNSKYPIPINLVPTLKEMILSKELKIEVSSFSDNKNDSSNKVSPNMENQRSQ
jgi:hypothetical protein